MPVTRIDILRHGLPEGGHRYRGHGIDDALSDIGWRQMRAAVGERHPWHRVISSPMARCRPFADAIARETGIPISVDDRLREVGFGAWEGRTGADIRAKDPDAIRRFYADPERERPSGAEPLEAFRSRVASALSEALDRFPGDHILVVAHAGIMRAALSWLLNAPLHSMYRADIPNAAFLSLRSDDERPPMIMFHGPDLE